jgi:serine/threonine-protein kinase
MEYVDGADLKALNEHLRITRTPFPFEAAVYITTEICEGLAYAHMQTNAEGEPLHAVHRDVSPPNVLISKHGEVKIADFGLAKASTQLEKSEAGVIKGKFSYLSPEAAHGKEVDARADIFATGVILWEMLAGRKLFQGETDYETVKLVQRGAHTPISQLRPDVGEVLDVILSRALAPDPAQRYSTAREFGRDLNRVLYAGGKPVGAFDIAELVQQAMDDRARTSAPAPSIIHQLIQQTLFEFTSLQDEGADEPSMQGGAKFEIASFENFGRWADEVVPEGRPSELLIKKSLPAGIFEDGNLAAIEGPEEPIPDSVRSQPGDDWSGDDSTGPLSLGSSSPDVWPEAAPAATDAPALSTMKSSTMALSTMKSSTMASSTMALSTMKSSTMASSTMASSTMASSTTASSTTASSTTASSASPSEPARRASQRPATTQRSVTGALVVLILAGVAAALWFSGAL